MINFQTKIKMCRRRKLPDKPTCKTVDMKIKTQLRYLNISITETIQEKTSLNS